MKNPDLRFRNMSPEKKLQLAEDLYWSARKLKKDSLKSLHPNWTEEKLNRKVKESFMYAKS
ncbi:MAG: hypothetical protein K9M56_09780 [Victivallales bacterium]|nr:hypothetical protein [Victivallales bacterium]